MLCPKTSGQHHLYLLHRIQSTWQARLSLRPTEPKSLIVLMDTLTLRERQAHRGPAVSDVRVIRTGTSSAYARTITLCLFIHLIGELATSQAETRHSLRSPDPWTSGHNRAGGTAKSTHRTGRLSDARGREDT